MRHTSSNTRRALGPSGTIRVGALLVGVFVALLLIVGDRGDEAQAQQKKKRRAKEQQSERVEARPIEVGDVWRETEVFTAEQLAKLEPILRNSRCSNAKVGCPYLDTGKPGREGNFSFRLIPWTISRHRAFLVRNDRCGAGGCDQGLFVRIDGRWRLVAEMFGMLERLSSATLGFNDLVVHPRGQAPVRLVWDGEAYREAR